MAKNEEARNRRNQSAVRHPQHDESSRESRGGSRDTEPLDPSPEREDQDPDFEDMDDMDEERDDDDRVEGGPNRRRSIS